MADAASTPSPVQALPVTPDSGRRGRVILTSLAFALFTIFAAGLFWIFTSSTGTPIGAGWFLFSFAAGLSMIVLPCTLPLAFVIVPLSMGKGYVKGLTVAIAFGIGVAVMLSTYGIFAALLGQTFLKIAGNAQGTPEMIKNVFYAIAGVFALIFALGELGLIKVRMPSYMGAAPKFIQRQPDIAKAFFLGLFLGNIGVGCPHPATPIILGQIGITGDVFYGWLLFLVHAIGRVIPLIFLAILGILGVNATKSLLAHKDSIARATAWGMVFVGAFLFTLGFFSHDWWVNSGQHTIFEEIIQEDRWTTLLNEQFNTTVLHRHGITTGTGFFGLPTWLGNWVFVLLIAVPLFWYWASERKRVAALAEPDKTNQGAVLRAKKWGFAILVAFLGVVFIQVLPHRFLYHTAFIDDHGEEAAAPVTNVLMLSEPSSPVPGEATKLTFALKDEKGSPLSGLAVSHERLFHVIITGEDFSTFAHIHPEDFASAEAVKKQAENAVFSVSYALPKPGRYIVAVDYLHETHEGTEQFIVDAGARGVATLVKDFSRIKVFDGYTVTLTNPLPLRSGESGTLKYSIKKDGAPVTDMAGYLGAPMHLAVISADLFTFSHTHGEFHDPVTDAEVHEVTSADRFGPNVEAHVVFPYPGIYQVFGEFAHNGKSVVTGFLVEIAQGVATMMGAGESAPHGH